MAPHRFLASLILPAPMGFLGMTAAAWSAVAALLGTGVQAKGMMDTKKFRKGQAKKAEEAKAAMRKRRKDAAATERMRRDRQAARMGAADMAARTARRRRRRAGLNPEDEEF